MKEVFTGYKGKKKIVALTCYDYTSAQLVKDLNLDILLVGDSLGMVMLGYPNTHFVKLDEMILFTQAVKRANPDALIVADMPIGTCDTVEDALKNCKIMVEQADVKAVKIEGKPEIVKYVVNSGIEVMGHTGLKPQEMKQFKVQRGDEIIKEALALEEAGSFAVILECIPMDLAKKISRLLKIPTIGIGAGKFCDGQILVWHDMLGLFKDFRPKFVRKYGSVGENIRTAIRNYIADVKEERFPGDEETYLK